MIKIIGNGGVARHLYMYLPALGMDVNKLPKSETDIIIETTNNPESKRNMLTAKAKLKISAAATENSCSLVTKRVNRLENLFPSKIEILLSKEEFLLEKYKGKEQGAFTSSLIAALVLDEIRKFYDKEENLEKINYGLKSEKRFSYENLNISEEREDLRNKRVLIVGAGGIGTYVCLNLVLMGIGVIDVYDGDVIEEHNLDRQIFYYGKIGEKKARVLAERLKKFNNNVKINPYPVFVKETRQLKKDYGAVFSCLDNWKGRFLLNRFALENNIRLINGAVTESGAKLEVSKCLECKYDSKELIKTDALETKGCSHAAHSTIIQNAFIGSLMAGEIKSIFYPEKYPSLLGKELKYFSKNDRKRKFTVLDEKMSCLCNKNGCKCHET